MSNNLRQIAKDLRSFVKRCKDVHYSDSLLITFLVTGLLGFAPSLRADVVDVDTEQQEITAQTYDTITELRQSFMRARKENEKSLRWAESELVQLLRQGDQVIKSPWASYQFGMGVTNNDWGTTYRGRGGKFLEFYRRNNDLTKYVFDANKHLYGATNLNIPRNQEPNSLTINPANVLEAYTPPTVTSLNTIDVPSNPEFAYTYEAPTAHWFNDGRRVKLDEWVDRRHTTTMPGYTLNGNRIYDNVYQDEFLSTAANNGRWKSGVYSLTSGASSVAQVQNIRTSGSANANANNSTGLNTAATGGILTTGTPRLEMLNANNHSAEGMTSLSHGHITSISGGTINFGTSNNYGYTYGSYYDPSTSTTYQQLNHGSGRATSSYDSVNIGTSGGHSQTSSGTAVLVNGTNSDVNDHHSWTGGTPPIGGWGSWTYNASGGRATASHSGNHDTAILLNSSDGVRVSGVNITIGDYNNAGTAAAGVNHSGIRAASGDNVISGNVFNINGKQANGVRVDSGTTTFYGNQYTLSNTGQNGISNGGTINVGDAGNQETFTFNNNYTKNNAIHNSGTANIRNVSITLYGNANNGIRNNGSTANLIFEGYRGSGSDLITVNGYNNNGVLTDHGVTFQNSSASAFVVNGYSNNGIRKTGGDAGFDLGSATSFTITGNNNNGIYNTAGNIDFYNGSNPTFTIGGDNNVGIYTTAGTLELNDGTFTINGSQQNTGIATTVNSTIKDTNFTLTGSTHAGIVSTGGTLTLQNTSGGNNSIGFNGSNLVGAYLTNGGANTVTGYNFNDTGTTSGSTGIHVSGSGTNLEVNRSSFSFNGANNHGIYVAGGAELKNVGTYPNSTSFNMKGSGSNGIYMAAGTTLAARTIYAGVTLEGANSNGIRLENAITGNNTFYGNYNIKSTASNSNGILFGGTSGTNTITAGFTVASANSNGVWVAADATSLNVSGSSFDVSGDSSNGIYVGNTGGSANVANTSISNSSFTVSGNNSTGVNIADNQIATALSVSGTSFDVNGRNITGSGLRNSGLYLNRGTEGANIAPTSTFTLHGGGAIGIAMNTSADGAPTKKELNFTGTDGTPVAFYVGSTDGSKYNTGILLQSGNSNTTLDTKIEAGNSGKGFDMRVGRSGRINGSNIDKQHNVGIVNTGGIKKLNITHGQIPAPAGGNTGSGFGVLEVHGNDNIGFANLGLIAATDGIKFNSIEIDGDRNVGLFFAPNTAARGISPTNQSAGWVAGSNKVQVQGVIGGVSDSGNASGTSINSFGVYATSGQSARGNYAMVGGANAQASDLDLDINMGVGSSGYKSVVVYAGKGTNVSMKNGSAYSAALSVNDTISDGEDLVAGQHKWGYEFGKEDTRTSEETTIAYADGIFKNDGADGHHLLNNLSSLDNTSSTITIKSHVDMVSRKGVAFRAENGGRVHVGVNGYDSTAMAAASTDAKNTRAGGYRSVIAYAAGSTTMVDGKSRAYSNVEINGDITAADSNALNRRSYNMGAGSKNAGLAYENLGAYAAGGATVNVKTTNASTTAVEAPDNAAATGGSLIYGMAAYATGLDPRTTENPNAMGLVTGGSGRPKSTIDFTVGNASGYSKGVGVVTGTNGALYAEFDGQIGFLGNIVNQNNAGNTIDTSGNYYGQSLVGKGIAMDTGALATRNGRGTGPNDHTNTTPFFVERTNLADASGNTIFNDTASITFGHPTNGGVTKIDMYDGVLLTGNHYYYAGDGGKPITKSATASTRVDRINGVSTTAYEVTGDLNGSYSDYFSEYTGPGSAEAKYRGMKNVNVAILGNIDLGLVNGATGLLWNNDQNRTTATGYLAGVAKYAGLQGNGTSNIKNEFTDNTGTKMAGTDGVYKAREGGGFAFTSSLINSDISIDHDVNLENKIATNFTTPATRENDAFNDIAMESTLVTINASKNVKGDIASGYRAGQGLSMANSLYRWSEKNSPNAVYRRSNTDESGYRNFGTIDVWGGTNKGGNVTNITAVNVANGIVANGDGTKAGVIKVDHGNAIVGTDGSILSNAKDSEITVTGIYTAGGTISALRTSNGFDASSETAVGPTGNNYGIVGISTKNVRDAYNTNNSKGRYGSNAVTISNTDGKITVEGNTAVGIYAQNTTYSGDTDVNTYNGKAAKQEDVRITYDNLQSTADPSLIKVNSTTASIRDNKTARGIGIALDHDNSGTVDDAARRGGKIHLNTQGNDITAANNKADILTSHNGIGIYAESAEITFGGNTAIKGLNVETKNRGIGVFVTDDSSIATSSDRVNGASTRKLYYNYTGDNDSQGYAVAFGSTLNREGTANTWATTTATNYLDIEFANTGATKEGISALLVNTDNTDTAVNYGNIKEHNTTVTHEKEYGAIVNRGRLVNHGKITLNDSLNKDAKDVTADDLKKVNIGIVANDHTVNARYNTFIENYNDITVGDVTVAGSKNVGNFAIYGYNVKTGKKADGSDSVIKISRNNYGIFSGDGNVDIQHGTKLFVGNDTVLGHVQTTTGKAILTNPNGYPINRQTAYTQAKDLLPGRLTDAAVGVYIGSNENLSNADRNVNVSADMDIDRFSYGIVMAENKYGTATTNVTIGSSTNNPTIKLASNTTAGGQVKSTAPSDPKVPEEVLEQGNAVYYLSADKNSRGSTYAHVTMNGDYNTAYFTKGSIDNYGTIDLRSAYDVENRRLNPSAYFDSKGRTINLGYGNVGIVSANPDVASTNYGTITTGMSDTQNMMYSAGMAAGRNVYKTDGNFDRVENMGYVINNGTIKVQEKEGIGMFATGSRSKAINRGTIELIGDNSIGMYLDQGAVGINETTGVITGNAQNLKGVIAINGGYIKNYGKIEVTGPGSKGIVTDGAKFVLDANGNPVVSTDASAKTAIQNNGGNGGTDLYGGTETSFEEGTSGNPKTTGVGTTITMPDVTSITEITVDGVNTPIYNVDTDAVNPGDWAKNITISSSIQTGGTRIIDLGTHDEWGNQTWPHHTRDQLSEVTKVGMYIDTSGVRYTNPIDGLENLPKLSKVDLYFGPEATLYTNAKAIRLGTNMLRPFNNALSNLSGGTIVNPLSASLTWQVAAKLDSNNQLTDVYMSKVPYHSFAYDDDKSLINFANNLDNIYEIARPGSPEKVIFNKLNSLGNGEGHILAQAFDQMRGHIYGGVQQRIKATSDVLNGEITNLKTEFNGSKDSNKFKAFGQRNEFKTDTAGMPDWYSNAGGFVFVHEDETVRLGEGSGWYAGVVNNYFTFKDLSKSFENQAMAKVGAFREIPLDANGTLTLNVGGDGFFGRTDTKRRFWVVDQEFRAKANYFTYGAGLSASLQKAFVVNDGFSIVPNIGIKAEYGRFSGIHETGDMALHVKSDDYISVKPSVGIDFKYNQPIFKNSNFTAVLALAYENEIGKVNDINNEARIAGAWTDYFGIKGDKEDKRGNFKSDLNLGVENGRFGFTVNTGYETKGNNFKAGLGMKVLY